LRFKVWGFALQATTPQAGFNVQGSGVKVEVYAWWERFATAMNPADSGFVIVVTPLEKQRDASKNHSHQA